MYGCISIIITLLNNVVFVAIYCYIYIHVVDGCINIIITLIIPGVISYWLHYNDYSMHF